MGAERWRDISAEKPTLVAVSLSSVIREWPSQRAIISGKSNVQDASFTFRTGLLNPEQIERCQQLEMHGFTVIEAPENWRYGYASAAIWQELVIQQAMNRVAAIFRSKEGQNVMSEYDAMLAEAVLGVLHKAFPNPLQLIEVKHGLSEEPSDDTLGTVLDGLQLKGFITGKQLYSHTTAKRKLVAMLNIQLTKEGLNHLEGSAQQIVPSGSIIHGDQYNNYGPAGAIGPHSQGVVNVYGWWKDIEHETDLQKLSVELNQLRTECRKIASSREDDKQVALLGEAEEEAEKGNGSGAAAILSRVGTAVLKTANDIGTEVAAKVIAKSLGIDQ